MPAALAALQRSAGNAAVVGAVQRLASGSGPPPPLRRSPATDPRFQAVKKQIAGKGAAARAHPPPAAEAKKAADAAVAPGNDKEAQAKAAQAATMATAKQGGFDKAAFVAAVNAAIAAQAPKTLDEADSFGSSGKADAVKGQVAGQVGAGKAASAKDIADKTAAAPDPSKAKDKPVTPLEESKPPDLGTVQAGSGMPAKAPAEQTDFRGPKVETDQKMADAGVTQEQLANGNEPQFTDALTAKKEGERDSATAPATVRSVEDAKLAQATQAAQQTGKSGLEAMAGAKKGALARGSGTKSAAKAKDEAARAQVATDIKGIFDSTKVDVDGILSGLDTAVAAKFDAGEKAARAAFTADHQARMKRYKDERYSGLSGAARWLKDAVMSLPPEANQIFVEAKKGYVDAMTRVISDVADFIGVELTRAKQRIAKGQADIQAYVAKQPKDLQKVAKDTAGQLAAQFQQLESDVDNKQNGLVDDLAAKYVEASNAVDEEIKAAQEANKGLWDKAKEAVAGAIETVLKLKDMLLGVLARAAGAIEKIIKDPIAFLGNLVNAVKTGVMNFAANIVEHLKKGLQSWLLGALGEAGIELPDKLDLKGIIKLVLSILGLTWPAIRARIVKHVPEKVMGAVEKGVAFISLVLSEGIGGLWTFVAEKLSDLKERVMTEIKDFVITKIVKAGITWLISMLNPAAAFIKACKMIYDVVMFFVEKAAQIKEFVDSVLDSVESIANGGVGAVAGLIEKTLAKMLPVLLGFLASLLGLGGISEKIKSVLATIQKPVMSVVDKLVAGAVKFGKSMMAKLGMGKEKDDDSSAAGAVKEEAHRRVVQASASATDVAAVRAIVTDVATQLRPQGLKSLVLAPSSTEGEYDIVATASPPTNAGKVVDYTKKAKRGADVSAAATIRYEQPPDLSSLGLPRAAAKDADGKVLYNSDGSVKMVPMAGPSAAHAGSLVSPSATDPNALDVLSLSGKTLRKRGTNVSHAEFHAANFAADFKAGSTVVSISMTLFGKWPCPDCVGSLKALKARLKGRNADVTCSIDLSNVKKAEYWDSGAALEAALTAAGWTATGIDPAAKPKALSVT